MTSPMTAPRATVIAVATGSGGVGGSSLVAALATRAARRGLHTLCADLDPGLGRLDVFFDRDSSQGARWPDLAQARGRLDGDALAALLPASDDGVLVLSGGLGPAPSRAAAEAGAGEPVVAAALTALACVVDLLVLDVGASRGLPPGVPCDDVILVAGYTAPALVRLPQRLALLEDPSAGARVWLVQRCPRGRGELGEHVAAGLDLPLLGVLPDDPGLDADLARGVAPGARGGRLAATLDRLLDVLLTQERAA